MTVLPPSLWQLRTQWLEVFFFFSFFFPPKIREQNLQDVKTAGPQSQVLCAGTVVERSFNQVSLSPCHEKASCHCCLCVVGCLGNLTTTCPSCCDPERRGDFLTVALFFYRRD